MTSVLAHWQLVSGELMLADYDAFVYFYPNREYTAARLLAGELPFWNPYVFGGAPHLANPQSAAFYPGTWLFLLLPTPQAYSLSLILHVAVAGVTMYLLLRHGLAAPPVSGAIAGLCYMLSGPLVAQGGHLNQLSAAALLPLVVLTQDLAMSRRSVGWTLIGGVLLALQLLAGHPQVVYMTLAVAGVLALWRLAGSPPASWLGQVGRLGGVALVGVGLAAVQLLPLLEVTGLGIRAGGLYVGEATSGSLPPELLPLALLPGYAENPPSTEFFGFIGAAGLSLAVIGAFHGLTRRDGWVVATAVLGILLALGSYTPVFEMLFGRLPGLSSFRVPARWLLVWTFSISMLAGLSFRSPARGGWRAVGLPIIAIFAGYAWLAGPSLGFLGHHDWVAPRGTLVAWAGLAAMTTALWLARERLGVRTVAPAIVAMIIVTELLLARLDLPFSHLVPSAAWRPSLAQSEQLRRLDPQYRVLSIAGDGFEPEESAALRERYQRLPGASFTQFLTALKWWEVQAPNLPSVGRIASIDGYDGGVLPLSRYVLVASTLHPRGDVRPDGVLISSLDVMPRREALDLFGVSLVLASVDRDVDLDGVIVDRAVPVALSPGGSVELAALPAWPAGDVVVLASSAGSPHGSGQILGEIEVQLLSGETMRIPLRSGIELAPGPGASPVVRVAPPWRESSGLPTDFFSRHPLPGQPLTHMTVRNLAPDITLRLSGVTLVSVDQQEVQPLLLDASLDRTAYGATRVYERRGALPRAYLTHAATVLDDDSAIVEMADEGWSPRDRTIVSKPLAGSLGPPSGTESVTLLTNEPERLVLHLDVSAPALLVLSDPWFPGWRAELNGQPVPIHRANIHFRAVEVPAGPHRLQFVYDAAVFKIGALVSFGAALLTGVGWLAVRRRRRPFG